MSNIAQSILRFTFTTTENPLEMMSRFFPQGRTALNRTAWRGKEPRSCGVTNVKMRPQSAGSKDPHTFDLEVTYRPKGCITFIAGTKYDGWTAMMLDRQKDGTLLDGHGNPLPEGQPPVYLPFEVHADLEFNELEFGEFVGEFEVREIPHFTFEEAMEQARCGGSISFGAKSIFMAARRNRQLAKIVISDALSGTGTDGFGTRLINVNSFTPHLELVLLDELTELISGFFEGRYSMTTMGNEDLLFLDLSQTLVDCRPENDGKESRFNCLTEYISVTALEELAKRLMAKYEIEISIVDGERLGFLLRRQRNPD